jgi:hypothetical protein
VGYRRDVRRRILRLPALSLAALASAGLCLALPEVTASAEGRDAGAGDAGPRDAAGSSSARIPPDPPALRERKQWVFDLRWDRGEIYLVSVHETDMGSPHSTPRVMGRFALELFEGPTLIERVRFDFPMLGPPATTDAGYKTPPRFEPKLRTRIGVFFPATKRGTKLELWDRARDLRWQLPWPPEVGRFGPPADAGAADTGATVVPDKR